jgi:hypothetical protein
VGLSLNDNDPADLSTPGSEGKILEGLQCLTNVIRKLALTLLDQRLPIGFARGELGRVKLAAHPNFLRISALGAEKHDSTEDLIPLRLAERVLEQGVYLIDVPLPELHSAACT